MTLADRIAAAQREALKARDQGRLSALRLITAAIKDREIALRTSGGEMTDAEVLALLGKMIKQRQDSAKVYAEGGRAELAGKEISEIKVIEEFLPRRLSAEEVAHAIEAAVAATGAAGLKDMGRVMAELKARYAGQMDFGAVGPQVKARLGQ